MQNLFDFWKDVGPAEFVHPADHSVLLSASHRFNLNCLPLPFYGPLRTAPIVMLYLAPGLSERDLADAKSSSRRDHLHRQRQGNQSLIGHNSQSWWVLRTKCFEVPLERLRSKFATLELCPYHSRSFHDWPLLAALPSCRTAISWAQDVLFPEARNGERVVICMRAAKFWGLTPGHKNEGLLFAPRTTRHGYMMKMPMRQKIIKAVQDILNEGR